MQLAAIQPCAIDRFSSPIEQHTAAAAVSRSSTTSSIIMSSSDNDAIDSSSYAVYDRVEDTGSNSTSNSSDTPMTKQAIASDIKSRLESSSSEIRKISLDKQQQEQDSRSKNDNNDVQCQSERQQMHYESTIALIEPITQHHYATTLSYDNNHHQHHQHHHQHQQPHQQQHYAMHQYNSSNYCHYCNSQRPCYCDTQLADTADLLLQQQQQQDSYTCKNQQLGDVIDITDQRNVHYNRTQQQQQQQQPQPDHSDDMMSLYRNNNNSIFPHQHHQTQQQQQFDSNRQQHRCPSTSATASSTTTTSVVSARSSSGSSAAVSTVDGYATTDASLRTPMLQHEPVAQHHYQAEDSTPSAATGACYVSNRGLSSGDSTDSISNSSNRVKSNDIQYQGEQRDQLHYETIASADPSTQHHYATTLNYDNHHPHHQQHQQHYSMHHYNGSSYCHYCNNQRPCDCDTQLADTTDLLMQQQDSYGCKNQSLSEVIEMSDQSGANYNRIQQQPQQQDHGHNGVISIYRTSSSVFPQHQPQQQQSQQQQQQFDNNNRLQQHRCSSTSTANSTPTSTSVRSSPGTSATASSIDGYAPPDSSLRIQLLQEPVLRHHFQTTNPAKTSFDVSTTNKSGRRGRPRKKGQRSKNKVNGKLWEFIRDLLLNDRTNPSFIRWERREDGVFKFVQSDKVAKMWGERKQNPKMTYEKLSRAMRYYYKSKVLLPVFGRRLVYKFGPNATGWKST